MKNIRSKSEQLFAEAKKMFPGGVHSPVRAFKSVSGAPLFIKNGNGCILTDEDDNKYIDFCCSWGPLILGHNPENVKKRIIETVKNGTSFGAPNKLGNEIGKLILNNHRYIDKIRFVSSGTEAVMSAIRLARGFTKKSKIIKFEGCYHGHVDSLLVKAGSGLATFGESTSAGIPESFVKETLVIPLNDLQKFQEVMDSNHEDIAAVIIEPIPANNGLLIQDLNYLVWLRKICDDYKVLLIFDEVISGFRVGFEGAAGLYRIQPDIITFGKIIGGGMPVGAYAASHEIMGHVAPDGAVYQAGTLSANPVAMSAGIGMLETLLQPNFYQDLALKTNQFLRKIEAHIEANNYKMNIQSEGSIFWFAFEDKRIISADQINQDAVDKFKIFHNELLNNGIYLGPSAYEVGFVSHAHKEHHLDEAASKINKALDVVFK